MARGSKSKKRPDMVGELNPRWARDGRVSVGQRFGSWTVLSLEPFQKLGALYVLARCDCGIEREANLRFMETKRSLRCASCAMRLRHANAGHAAIRTDADARLHRRVQNWFQRCNNQNDGSYRNYGGRGIECRFSSVREAMEYVKATLPHETYLGVDIDREDNDGHYEPGNLRLISRQGNLRNKRGNNLVSWRGKVIPTISWGSSPYSLTCTMRYAAQGLSGEDILRQAWKAVEEKRKCWRLIEARLLATIS